MESNKPLYAATCPTGLEKILEKELRALAVYTTRVENRLVFFEADDAGMMRVNMAVRTAQRIWRVMAHSARCDHFDRLYELARWGEWEKFVPRERPVRIHASSVSSVLDSEPTMQKLVRRAIGDRIRSLPGDERDDEEPSDVLALILRDEAWIMLDTSGAPLHKRGYRPRAGEAPIKETLAAGLVLLSGWDGSMPFVDPFGGSGTIAIEAAQIALNIPPNTIRSFAFERFLCHTPETFVSQRVALDARAKTPEGLSIRCIDADVTMAEVAWENVDRAWLLACISVETAPFPESVRDYPAPFHCVTNPPYGNRLKSDNLPELYRELSNMFQRDGVSGGFITSYPIVDAREYRNRKLRNGAIECRFYQL